MLLLIWHVIFFIGPENEIIPNPHAGLSWNISQCLQSLKLTSPFLCLSLTFSFVAFFFPFPFSLCLALAEINRRYLTLMWEHNVSYSVETTFVSATGLFALGDCTPLSCKAAWRYSCCRKGSKVGGRGEFHAMWKWKECVVQVCDTCGGLYD